MSIRGKRFIMHLQSLVKRAQLRDQDNIFASRRHERGTGKNGANYRYRKRQERKRLLAEEEGRKKRASELQEQADALVKEAATYEPWCHEEAQRLIEQAGTLRSEAEKLLNYEKPAAAGSLHSKSSGSPAMSMTKPAYRYRSCSSPVYSHASCVSPVSNRPWTYRPDPQIAALAEAIRSGERNFMDGISYMINPVDTLKMISASSVFGEPQYYRSGDSTEATILDGTYGIDRLFTQYCLRMLDPFTGMKTSQVMEKAIDEALTADFEATLKWAVELRHRYLMRLNPQVILVRAAAHPGRKAYTRAHPGEFAKIARKVMMRGDDVTSQVQYWLAQKGSKKGIPAVLKRSWAQRISGMDAYSMAKYGKAGIGLVDVVRICHAKGELVDILMRDGRVPMPEGENTWERLRAAGMGWQEILTEIRMPHMALLRNLRGIFSEVRDPGTRSKALELLKQGVGKGKQFPFRYLSAWKAVTAERAPWTPQVQSALEDCMKIACGNLPELQGRCAFLTDNSGSAWGTCTSEWGTMKVAEIGNLSSVIGAMCAEEGTVFPFGDKLKSITIHKYKGVLEQERLVSHVGRQCGMATENGIWLFFRDAIIQKQHWDNIFVYSDMQAGHGGLYGIRSDDYAALGACVKGMYIDVNMLVKLYRQQVNPRVNVFCIQTAGYTNVLVPEYGYRTAVLYGWTGRELLFADAINRIWNELESREPEQQ